jgi:MerR family copper efflux transcriptional regulator
VDIEQRSAELRKTRIALRRLYKRAANTDPSTCTETDICTIIGGTAPA